MQILCHFVWGTWASLDFDIHGGSWLQTPWTVYYVVQMHIVVSVIKCWSEKGRTGKSLINVCILRIAVHLLNCQSISWGLREDSFWGHQRHTRWKLVRLMALKLPWLYVAYPACLVPYYSERIEEEQNNKFQQSCSNIYRLFCKKRRS